jgi:epoxyqueuosine reductase
MPPLSSADVKTKAREVGFDLCGVARAERHPKLDRLREWIDRGRAGEMRYLADSLGERADPRRVLPTVRSIVSVAVVYNTAQPYSTGASANADDLDRAAIARYAWGDDYHAVLRTRLRALLEWMAAAAGPPGSGFEAFSCVDDGPVQERVWAEQAGLGWIGKNTCLINPSLGSWLFLAEILCNADLEPDTSGVDQCGACTRCLDACPTGAIVEPYAIDATRCLSYLTIEARGAVDESLRPAIGGHLFGCDICQDVCPWNRHAAESDDPAWQPRGAFAFPKLVDLCRLSDADWVERLKGSAIKRAGLHRIRRTLAYALGSSADPGSTGALDTMAREPSGGAPVVSDAIAWARRRRRA